jgi:hypothetical protein
MRTTHAFKLVRLKGEDLLPKEEDKTLENYMSREQLVFIFRRKIE